jgi:hypothetical protein
MPESATLESVEIPIQPTSTHKPNTGARLASGIVRASIGRDVANGLSREEIAAKYGITKGTVSYHVAKLREQDMEDRAGTWRSHLRVYAIKGIQAGLRCPDDPYKRGTLGVAVLKGLGDFAGDVTPVQINLAPKDDDFTMRFVSIHGRYPTELERRELEAKPVQGERVDDREEV